MKKKNWLDVTEYLLLAGSGIGAAVAIASQQLAFTATPMSLLLMVNLLNRRRTDQAIEAQTQENLTLVEQRLLKQIEIVDRRVQGLPTFWDLASLRKTVLQKNRLATSQIHQEMNYRLTALELEDHQVINQQVEQLQAQQHKLQETIDAITTQLPRSSGSDRQRDTEAQLHQLQTQLSRLQVAQERLSRNNNPAAVKELQREITALNRRISALPNPIDATRLRQEVESLRKVVNDSASRREFLRLLEEVEHIRTQQESLDTAVAPLRLSTRIMRRQVETLLSVMRNHDMFTARLNPQGNISADSLGEVKATIAALEQRLQHLPSEADLVQLRGEMDGFVGAKVESLHQEIQTVQQSAHNIEQQQQMMEGWIKRLPEFLDFSSLRNQIKYLSDRVDIQDSKIDGLDGQLLDAIQPQRQSQYELIFDLPIETSDGKADHKSRELLATALAMAANQVTVVVPKPDRAIFDPELLQQVEAFLDRGGRVDLGWGYLSDLDQEQQPRYILERNSVINAKGSFLKRILIQLNELRRNYPDQFRFKVLGTDDNFLVCDQSYAVLGAQVSLQSHAFPKLSLGLRTTNVAVIQRLTERFDQPDLNEDDEQAYFKRALTRAELDEKDGAIADYSRAIQINPKHDTAYNNRGLLRYDLGNREGAIADFNRAILINPANSIAYCNRGVVRSEMGNLMGAVEDFSDAIHVAPNCTPAYFQRGQARTQMGNKMGAVEDFSDVIRLNDQDASAFYYRGMARTKLGDRIGAIRDLKESARLFSAQENSSGYQQALNSINQLQKSLVIEGSGEGSMAARSS
jgi:tetratricopeptide (TPR) repeat protein